MAALDGLNAMAILKIGAAVLITVVWALIFLNAYVLDPASPKPPAEFSAPMLAVVTWLFGSEIRKQIKNGNGGKNG